ncbi:MAG TPA: ATP-grasp domain-containing protein [Edaphocola sp.]|nr:ATP-grasp domain-containing protein [Edaphocola sp.]
MNNILICSAGQRVSLVRAFQKELKLIFPDAKVFTVDNNPSLAPACHVSDGYQKVKRVNEAGYIDELINICIEKGIKLIVPTIDTELKILSEHRQQFLERGIIPIVSDNDFVEKCRDKRLINIFFQENDIEIPRPIDKNALEFPLFLKPYDGSLSKDIFLIHNKEELTDYHLNHPKLMFMEYIPPQLYSEFTVDAYYNQEGVFKCAVPRKRIFVRAGEINKGVTSKNRLLEIIKEKLSIIKGARACLTMQFFMHNENKRIVAIEINPRFGGGYPLSYLAGANFPKWIIEEYIQGKEICPFEGWEDQLLMLRYDDEILVHGYKE